MIRIACAALLSSQLISPARGHDGASLSCSAAPATCSVDVAVKPEDRPYFSRGVAAPSADGLDRATVVRNIAANTTAEAVPRALIGREIYRTQRFVEMNPGIPKATVDQMFRDAAARGRQLGQASAISSSAGLQLVRGGIIGASAVVGAAAGAAAGPYAALPVAVGTYSSLELATGVARKLDALSAARLNGRMPPEDVLKYNNYLDARVVKDPRFGFVRGNLTKGEYANDVAAQADLARALDGQREHGEAAVARAGEDEPTAAGRFRRKHLQYMVDPNPTKEKKQAVDAAAAQALREQVNGMSEALEARDQRDAGERRERFMNGLYATTGLLSLSGNPKVRRQAERLARVGHAVYDVSQLTRDAIAKNPLKAANMYVMTLSVVMDFFGGDGEASEFAAIHDALNRLEDQVNHLREEMAQHFRALDARLAYEFEQVTHELRRLHQGQRNVERLINNLRYEQNKRAAADAKKQAEADERVLSEIKTRCLPNLRSGSYLDAAVGERCVVDLAQFALGNPLGLARNGEWDHDAFDELLATVRQHDGSFRASRAVDPAQAAEATELLLSFVRRYPQYRTLAPRSPEFVEAIREIEAREDLRARMAITDEGGFRADVFRALVKQHHAAAGRLLDLFDDAEAARRGRLPATTRRIDPEVERAALRHFGEPTIGRCSTAPVLNHAGYAESGFDFGVADRYENKREAENFKAARQRALHTYDEAQMRLDVSFARLLPPIALVAHHLRGDALALGEFRLSYCFKRAEITKLRMVRDAVGSGHHDVFSGEFPGRFMRAPFQGFTWNSPATVGAAFELEVRARYLVDGEPRDLPIATFKGESEQTLSFFDPRHAPNLLAAIWNGTAFPRGIANESVRLFPTETKDPGTGQNIARYGFKAALAQLVRLEEATDEVRRGREQLQRDYDQRAGGVTSEVMSQALAMGQVELDKIARTRWQLNHVFTRGLDLTHPGVSELFARTLGSLAVPGDVLVGDAGARGTAAVRASLAERVKEVLSRADELAKARDLRPAPGGDVPALPLLPPLLN